MVVFDRRNYQTLFLFSPAVGFKVTEHGVNYVLSPPGSIRVRGLNLCSG